MEKICISRGNSKMGEIPSFSFPACKTCNPNAPCFKLCYARRLSNFRKNMRNSYERNLRLFLKNPKAIEEELNKVLKTNAWFRFNVSGDINVPGYFPMIVRLAENNPHCHILMFTKCYDIVNNFPGTIPNNLHIMFSQWRSENGCFLKEEDNPNDYPVADVLFKNESVKPDMITCGGNCSECYCRGTGCWNIEKGNTIYLFEH